jgi:hypothetical protein
MVGKVELAIVPAHFDLYAINKVDEGLPKAMNHTLFAWI